MSYSALVDDVALAGPEGLRASAFVARATVAGLLSSTDDESLVAFFRYVTSCTTPIQLIDCDGYVIRDVRDMKGVSSVEKAVADVSQARRACGVTPWQVLNTVQWRLLWYIAECRTDGAPAAVGALSRAFKMPLLRSHSVKALLDLCVAGRREEICRKNAL
jgi:hypothetical protein